MSKVSDIEKFMKELDAKYQQKWEMEKQIKRPIEEYPTVNLHLDDDNKEKRIKKK